jgi:hypothetical protein
MPQTIVNITSAVNKASIRKEKRNGRDVIIVPSATLPDDVVMNGILYPADEIAAGFKSLERSPAPLGHPTLANGGWVSASDPEGLAMGWIGAWNENVVRRDGRVFMDKVIDVANAQQSEGGQRVLDAIDDGSPISTSTGLLCMMEKVTDKALNYKMIARSMVFDHDAILLDEDPAASPEQGVGMLVNSSGAEEKVVVINSYLTEAADRDIDWAIQEIIRAQEKLAQAPIFDRVKAAVLKAIGKGSAEETEPSEQQNKENADMDDKAIQALSDKVVSGLTEALNASHATLATTLSTAIGEAVANAMKPVTEAAEAATNAQKAKDEAELTELRTTLVNAAVVDEDGAQELTLALARNMASKLKPGKAAPLNAKFGGTNAKSGFEAPEGDA